jgi:hypothetical protein
MRIAKKMSKKIQKTPRVHKINITFSPFFGQFKKNVYFYALKEKI